VAEVVIALGSNLGDRGGNLRRAVHYLLREGILIDAASSIWETPPFPEGQSAFYNAAIRGRTALEPLGLLELLKRCGHDLGRRETWHWGPRVIDLDILIYSDIEVNTADLVIPHPRIAERAFVLVPLAEVWTAEIPVLGEAPAELLARLDVAGITRTKEVLETAAGGPDAFPGPSRSH
jgi:2-amino-4-hydroxy-6-hydroxymethyldihydropteridine diphosphokinase